MTRGDDRPMPEKAPDHAEQWREQFIAAAEENKAIRAERDQLVAQVEKLEHENINGDMAGGILEMIRETLDAITCHHEAEFGRPCSAETPAMMYPEWIQCIVSDRMKRIRALEAQVEKADALANGARAFLVEHHEPGCECEAYVPECAAHDLKAQLLAYESARPAPKETP